MIRSGPEGEPLWRTKPSQCRWRVTQRKLTTCASFIHFHAGPEVWFRGEQTSLSCEHVFCSVVSFIGVLGNPYGAEFRSSSENDANCIRGRGGSPDQIKTKSRSLSVWTRAASGRRRSDLNRRNNGFAIRRLRPLGYCAEMCFLDRLPGLSDFWENPVSSRCLAILAKLSDPEKALRSSNLTQVIETESVRQIYRRVIFHFSCIQALDVKMGYLRGICRRFLRSTLGAQPGDPP